MRAGWCEAEVVLIRPAERDDLPGMVRLYGQLNRSDPEPDRQRAERAWAAMLESDLITVFVAETKAILASSCTLVIVPNITRNARSYALIENVVTDTNHRRQGLARSVLAAALDAAWAADCYKVMLATGRRDAETLRFYERSGFTRGGKTFFEVRRI